jgi:hypothetical protein
MEKNRKWNEDELRVLTAVFFASPFAAGDDARYECILIADCFDRTPSSIDRQWRNVSAILNEKDGYNIGAGVKHALNEYLENPVAAKKVALRILERNKWPLNELISAGTLHKENLQETEKGKKIIAKILDKLHLHLNYKIFASGSHGFSLIEDINLKEHAKVKINISVTLLNIEEIEVLSLTTTVEKMLNIIREKISQVKIIELPSGRCFGQYGENFRLDRHKFTLSIRIIELQQNGHIK